VREGGRGIESLQRNGRDRTDLAEDDVLAVQPVGLHGADEELGSGRWNKNRAVKMKNGAQGDLQ